MGESTGTSLYKFCRNRCFWFLDSGKDMVIFLTKEDYDVPSTTSLPDLEEEPGLILENGDINWQCPCLGGMATGPCGVEFREAFSCFHYSEEEIKGADCYEQFKQMQDCMGKYPELYDADKDDGDLEADDEKDALEEQIIEDRPADKNTDIKSTEKALAS